MHTLSHLSSDGPIGVDALPGQRHSLTLPDGTPLALVQLTGPQGAPLAHAASGLPTPLLVLHSVNAAASAFEMAPLVLRQALRRPVVVIDLPGFGASGRPDIAYTPRVMQQALAAALDWTRNHVAPGAVDVLALSLACEFATEVALQQPQAVRTLALVSPTGMEARRAAETYADGDTRAPGWARRLLRGTPLGAGLFWLLTRRPVIRWFLARSWGRADFDQRLLAHAQRTAGQAGARFAPLDFVAGALFTRGIIERYRALPVPVWVAHGTRGSFNDFGACPSRTGVGEGGASHPVERSVFDTGAMPHAEQADAFDAAYLRFLHSQRLVDALSPRPPAGAGLAAGTAAPAAPPRAPIVTAGL